MSVNGQRLADLTLSEHLDGNILTRSQAVGNERFDRHIRSGIKAGLEVLQVDGLCVRSKGSNGIDFFMFGPRNLRIRTWIGIWPPSKRARSFEPEREP